MTILWVDGIRFDVRVVNEFYLDYGIPSKGSPIILHNVPNHTDVVIWCSSRTLRSDRGNHEGIQGTLEGAERPIYLPKQNGRFV